ncbi:HFCD family protein [Streptomyces marincola]|uniref:flavoprotein n=1 Tax=Streptomyces marincola TaxID=2878388 RepID=UPI001CF347FA|nr:flavoprotein [Streptomyces marincola]UCM90275.1 flavoprotein [Streptomyces marincola]
MPSRVLYLLACAAPPVRYVDRAVRDAQARGWEVCLGMTPTAATWCEDRLPALAALTGRPVRTTHSVSGRRSDWPPSAVTVLAPGTLNTIDAVALGLTPTWVAGVAVEAVGKRWPLVAMPCVNTGYGAHPRFARSLDELRAAGVRVLYGPGGFVPNESGRGRPDEFPWHLALDAADAALPR